MTAIFMGRKMGISGALAYSQSHGGRGFCAIQDGKIVEVDAPDLVGDINSATKGLTAAASLLISVLRQRFEKRADAEAAIDEIFGKSKAALLEHYDGATGRKKGIFPYDQHLHPGLVTNKSKIIPN